MPGKDGTGPQGQGPVGGGRAGRSTSGGRGRMGGGLAAGPGGYCVCPKCGEKIVHQQGVSCNAIKCPKCGSNMGRG